jgi:two-component system, chemotaxis family, response regulator PixG
MLPTISKLAGYSFSQQLTTLQQQRSSGELRLSASHNSKLQWQIYFSLGRVIHASGGLHPVRRWYRSLGRHCPHLITSEWLSQAETRSPLWELDLLYQGVQDHQLDVSQAKLVVKSLIQEVIFDCIEQESLDVQWQPNKLDIQHFTLLSAEKVLQDAQLLSDQWREAGLGHLQKLLPQFSPDLAPVVRSKVVLQTQVSPAVFDNLMRLLQGRLTLRDVALQLQQSLARLMRSLLPLIRCGAIELIELPDLPAPFQLVPPEPLEDIDEPETTIQPKIKGLIACIDDSPLVCQTLSSILQPAGYEVLLIQDPLQGLATLVQRPPDLIFLDLVMPNTNGYEVCAFLRKATVLKEIPIIILTGQDGVMDRVKAKFVGATEFVAKPPVADKILQMVERYVQV